MINDRSFAIYIAGGALSAAIDIGIFQLLLVMGASLILATSAGFLISLIVNYLFHARYTFAAKVDASSIGKYLLVVVANYLLTLGLVTLAFGLLGSALCGKLIALPIIALIGYFAGRHWIFK